MVKERLGYKFKTRVILATKYVSLPRTVTLFYDCISLPLTLQPDIFLVALLIVRPETLLICEPSLERLDIDECIPETQALKCYCSSKIPPGATLQTLAKVYMLVKFLYCFIFATTTVDTHEPVSATVDSKHSVGFVS